jgi:hypothetical protein
MIDINPIDIFYKKQHKLVLTGLALHNEVRDLLTDINFLLPDLYNTDTVSKIRSLCDKLQQQLFSKEGDA